MASDLLSCPFCGGTELKSGGDDKIVGTWCLTCEATGPNEYGKFTWDHRARIAALEAELAEARAERDDEKREHEYWARRGMALTMAIKELPDVPPVHVLDMLSAAGKFPEDWERGKVMQRQHRLEAIPPRTEYEIGAGVWGRLLAGFRAEARATAAEARAEKMAEALTSLGGDVGVAAYHIDEHSFSLALGILAQIRARADAALERPE